MAPNPCPVRGASPPEPVTPPPAKRKKGVGAKALANMMMSHYDSDEEVLKPIRRTPPVRSPSPDATSDSSDDEARSPTPPSTRRSRQQRMPKPFDNPDWSDPEMSPPRYIPRPTIPIDVAKISENEDEIHFSYPYILPRRRYEVDQTMTFGSQPPPHSQPNIQPGRKAKASKPTNSSENDSTSDKTPGGTIRPLPLHGEGYGAKSSAEKYAERTQELRGGKETMPEEEDHVRYAFSGQAWLRRLDYKQLRELKESTELAGKFDGKGGDEGKDVGGRVLGEGGVKRKRKLCTDKDKPKRKYSWKNGKPNNPRKQGNGDMKAKGKSK